MIWVYRTRPIPAPRQSRRDTFKPLPRVKRYHAYQDELRHRKAFCPLGFHHLIFVLPMPQSWPKARLAQMDGMPHDQTPDRDNLEKAFLDSVLPNDCVIYDGRVTKLWGLFGLVIVSDTNVEIGKPARLNPFYDWAMKEAANTIRLSHLYSEATPVL